MKRQTSNCGNVGRAIGDNNRDRIKTYMLEHIGATNVECSKAIGLSVMAVGRHIKGMRAEWRQKIPLKRKPVKSHE